MLWQQQIQFKASQPETALHIVGEATPTDLPVFIRGDAGNKGPIVRRHLQLWAAQ